MKELIKNITLLLITLAVCFILSEILLTLFWQEPSYGYPKGLHIPDDTKGYKYQPNFHGNFQGNLYKDIGIDINSKGLRDYEHNYTRKSNQLRILGLGDSVAFGSGVSYEDTYLRQLEKKMLDNNYDVEIIKAGVGGYDFDQEAAYYFEEGYKYDPDIVIIGFILNDISEINPQKVKEDMFGKEGFIPKVRFNAGQYSKTYKFVHYLSTRIKQRIQLGEKDYNDAYFKLVYDLWKSHNNNYKKFESKLIKLNDNLKEYNTKLVLVVFPYTEQFNSSLNYGRLPQVKILNISKLYNITYIDLIENLNTEDYKDYYLLYDNLHLNGAGYKKVADVIYKGLFS